MGQILGNSWIEHVPLVPCHAALPIADDMTETRHFTLDGARRRDPAVECWFSASPDELRQIASRWFEQMRSCGSDVLELLHDGRPTACIGNLPFACVQAFRSHVNIGFFFGTVLDDPASLLEGSGRFMRHVKVHPGVAIHERELGALIVAAYEDAKARGAGPVV